MPESLPQKPPKSRKKHAEELFGMLKNQGHEPVLLTGEIDAKERKTILSSLPRFEHEHRIIVATESLLGEGFDLSYLDTLLIATPISWDGSITQQAGSIEATRASDGLRYSTTLIYLYPCSPACTRRDSRPTPSSGTKST